MKQALLGSLLLAVVVIGLGAFTRLTDAGLGCPDWPGCYGQLAVPSDSSQIAKAEQAYPERPFEAHKAWNEMVHRYFAGSLGLLVFVLTVMAWRRKQRVSLALLATAVIVFQAALGMWTVTLGLMPLVVMGHLLGGFSMLSILYLWYRTSDGELSLPGRRAWPVYLGMLILVGQIALGGWTSANYAALSCQGLPVCHEPWTEQYRLDAFHPLPQSERGDYEFGVLSHQQRVSIHVTHRIWAAVTAAYWLLLCLSLLQTRNPTNRAAATVLTLLFCQVGLGVANVLWQIPLGVAVAHNLGAALLLLSGWELLLSHSRQIVSTSKEVVHGTYSHSA